MNGLASRPETPREGSGAYEEAGEGCSAAALVTMPLAGLLPVPASGHPEGMHKTTEVRDPGAAFPLPRLRDDAKDRREANRAVAVSAIGLAATGVVELLLALVTGSVGLLGDAIHNLSDVSTSFVVFLGFRLSRHSPTER